MLAAAERVFSTKGFYDASMDEIAAECGITKPMLYSYFGSKQELFAACAERLDARLRDYVSGAAERRDIAPAQRLWLGLLGFFSFVEENRQFWAAYHPYESQSPPTPFIAAGNQGEEAWAGLLGELFGATARDAGLGDAAAAQAVPLAGAVAAAAIAMARWWLRHPDEPKELQALRLMNLVWNGFAGLLEGRLWLPDFDQTPA